MKKKPLKLKESLLNKEMKIIILGAGFARDLLLFLLFYFLLQENFPLILARTVIFATAGFDSLIYIFSLKSLNKPIWKINPLDNMYLNFSVLFSALLLILGIYWHPLQIILSTTALGLREWFFVLSIGILSVIMIESIKLTFRQRIE